MSTDDPRVVEEEVIESIERSAEVYGLSRSAGRVYGVLYFADGPLSIPELVEETGYAKSTISTVTRQLTRIGVIHRRSSAGGGRRVRFSPETDLWFVLQDVFRQYVAREMELSQRTLDEALARLDETDASQAATYETIADLAATYERHHALLAVLLEYAPEDIVSAIEASERR